MTSLVDFLNESLGEELNKNNSVNEGKVTDEKSFRELAEKKLKEVHGDDYDEAEAKKTIDGILEDNKELVEKGDWGALVGVLEKGIAKKD
jgi:hypothetical protein